MCNIKKWMANLDKQIEQLRPAKRNGYRMDWEDEKRYMNELRQLRQAFCNKMSKNPSLKFKEVSQGHDEHESGTWLDELPVDASWGTEVYIVDDKGDYHFWTQNWDTSG